MMKDMNSQMEKSRKEKEKIEAVLKEKIVSSSSGGGMVEISMNALFELVDINIAEEIINKDNKTMIETLLVSAFNDAVKKAQEIKEAEMTKALQSLFGTVKA